MSNPRSGIYLQNRKKKQAVNVDLPIRAAEGDGDVVCVDLISGLPEPILHHILCFLTQREAVQTSVLSKSWRNIGPTRPKFDFCDRHFGGDQRKFISIIESTLYRCLNLNGKLAFHEFCLEMLRHDLDNLSTGFLAAWIPLVLDNMSIKSFHLSFFTGRMPYFDVPTNLLRTESLEKLRLNKCNLKIHCVGDVKLKHLKSLKLIEVFIEDKTLEFLLLGCPLIEDLVISQCHGLKNIKLKECFNLKHFGYYDWNRAVDISIEINIQSIESISINRYPNRFHCHQSDSDDGNNVFPLLKSLLLLNVHLSSEFFDCLSCRFPCLETLNIEYCYGLEEYQISSRSIKHLKIMGSAKAVIDAPNLVKFEYEGRILPSISFEKTSVNWKSKLVLKLDVNSKHTASSRCLELYEILKGFVGSQISLDISIHYIWENCKHLKEFSPSLVAAQVTRKPIAVEHMTIQLKGHSASSLSALINDVFCFVRPRNMTQFVVKAIEENQLSEYQKKVLLTENQLSEYLKKVLLSERVMRHCYSWKQDLEEASIEIDPSLTSFIDDEIQKEPFMFQLKWKE